MKDSEEIGAIVNTYAYAKCKGVYDYCEKEYCELYKEYEKALEEIRILKMHNSRLKNKMKGYKSSYLEDECKRLRELSKKYLSERDMYKRLYAEERRKTK